MLPAQPRCMYPAEFVSCLWQFKHPSYTSCGVERNRWGDAARDAVGLGAHGTIWFATPEERTVAQGRQSGEKEDSKRTPLIVPADCLPFATTVPSTVDPVTGRRMSDLMDASGHRFKRGLARGWLETLLKLTQEGYLRADEELSALLGVDTLALIPPHLAR